MNSKLHAVCDGKGRLLIMLLSEGQMSDYKGAALMIDASAKAKALLADRGYDADWFRHALAERSIIACIPSVDAPKDAKVKSGIGGSRMLPSVRPVGAVSAPARPQTGVPT